MSFFCSLNFYDGNKMSITQKPDKGSDYILLEENEAYFEDVFCMVSLLTLSITKAASVSIRHYMDRKIILFSSFSQCRVGVHLYSYKLF